ncbi:hypothetical protein CWB99_12970 [Pseudoalteromonas rubra]|uniref:Uncharacterized protein n=1 Tax=Pseudoalteromonas rubra TaxID=43658 RepID=A0A5S3WM50_9GAMM|nr:hypothetical protein [Pseudoalteromonas rubra]TMP28021.1 hypothetical protein CWB99_12970 [Pseudoalteromonas rubra]TMP29233.1 hypothetical protein CWC00_19625 [Pseudoalteromonas rubra]
MIDSKTKERIVVLIDEEAGPYIRVSTWDDADALEDLLSGKYDVLYEMKTPAEFMDDGGKEYYFGSVADPAKLQAILDEITV